MNKPNFENTPRGEKPDLPERANGNAFHREVECPECKTFRPALTIAKHGIPGKPWTCDGCFSAWDRENNPDNYK